MQLKSCQLADTRACRRRRLHQQAKFLADVVGLIDDAADCLCRQDDVARFCGVTDALQADLPRPPAGDALIRIGGEVERRPQAIADAIDRADADRFLESIAPALQFPRGQ